LSAVAQPATFSDSNSGIQACSMSGRYRSGIQWN
jgi:hypothetical protein